MCSKEKIATELQSLVQGTDGSSKAVWRGRHTRREPSINPSVEFSEEGTLACWVQKKKRTPSILRFTGAYSKRWLVIDPRTKTIEYSHAIDDQRKLLCEFRDIKRVVYEKDHKSKKKLIIKLRKKKVESVVKMAETHIVFEFNKYLARAIKIFLDHELNWANASLFRRKDLLFLPHEVMFYLNNDQEDIFERYMCEFCTCDQRDTLMSEANSRKQFNEMPSLERLPQSLRGKLHTKRSENMWEELLVEGLKQHESKPDLSANPKSDEPLKRKVKGVFLNSRLEDTGTIGEMSLDKEMR